MHDIIIKTYPKGALSARRAHYRVRAHVFSDMCARCAHIFFTQLS